MRKDNEYKKIVEIDDKERVIPQNKLFGEKNER